MVLRKDQLEVQLREEHQQIRDGLLKEDSPLDVSPQFQGFLHTCRVGDLKGCQEAIAAGTNINARDTFDYTPLILASLCGHYEVVQLLLESGALCERDTFQGERCLYNALNNRIRNLLLEYDYSKSTDPLQPLASHITSLLTRNIPKTSDICLTAASEQWNLHKFILSARSPYFQQKLYAAPETALWKLASTIPPEAFQVTLRYIYLGDIPSDLGLSSASSVTEEDVLNGIDKVCKQLEINSLWQLLLSGSNRRLARQRYQDEVSRGRNQIEKWYRDHVLKYKILIETSKAQDVKWTRDNAIFADVLLRADEEIEDAFFGEEDPKVRETLGPLNGIPIGPSISSQPQATSAGRRQSVLYPCHRAMLLRSEYFQKMFESSFVETQITEYLYIVKVDCTPAVLEIILDFLYTEKADMPIELALDVLYAADMLFIEKLKNKAAQVISTVGMGIGSLVDRTHTEVGQERDVEVEPINVYDVIRAGWDLKVQRLEEFSARYLAFRLEDYIDEEEFEELIKESASRIQGRQETDTIELLDDIRYYLDDRFRLRFEDSGLEDIMDKNRELNTANASSTQLPDGDASPLPPTQVHPNTLDETDEAIDMNPSLQETQNSGKLTSNLPPNGGMKTLDGDLAEDEFAADAINYQVLIGKIDALLERLNLAA